MNWIPHARGKPWVADLTRIRPHLVWAAYIGVNLGLLLHFREWGPDSTDWQLFLAVRDSLDNPYVSRGELPYFAWSPSAAWLMAAVTHVGYWAWLAVHFGALALIRDGRLLALTLLSWAFWTDAMQGNTMTFVFVSGVLALGGSRLAALAHFALFLLMPRPLQVPVILWLLWHRADLRLPFLLLAGTQTVLVLASGLIEPWMGALHDHRNRGVDFTPARWIGPWWLAAGIPLAAWLTWRRRLGWAGLAMSPYVLPQYLMMWPLKARGPTTARSVSAGGPDVTRL